MNPSIVVSEEISVQTEPVARDSRRSANMESVGERCLGQVFGKISVRLNVRQKVLTQLSTDLVVFRFQDRY